MRYENSGKRVILVIIAALAVLSLQVDANQKNSLTPIVIGIMS
jgi:hypothetical protein